MCLVWATFGINKTDFLEYPVREFNLLINQAINIGAYWATGDLQTRTGKDELDLLKGQYRELKSKGLL